MATVSITDLTNAKLDTDHIADIATSLALTAVDRLGTTKKTLQGAINSIAAIDVKGAWATTTAYVVKDAVLESGTWYICLEAHTSGTFATDLAAGKWSVLQGITDANLKDYTIRKLDFVSDMKAMTNPQAGEIIMLKDYASGNNAGVMYFETKATTGTDDGGSVINHNTLAFRFEQIFGDVVSVKQFGALGLGTSDEILKIQAALDLKLPTYIPQGTYNCSASVKPHQGQRVFSYYTPQHSTQGVSNAVVLRFEQGVHGIDLAANTAIGAHVEGLILLGASNNADGFIGVKLGTEGVVGSTSNNVRTNINKVLAIGFDIGFGVYGFSWEVSLDACHAFYSRTFGFDIDDSATILDMRLPSAQNGGIALTNWKSVSVPVNASALGYNIQSTGDIQINMHSPRAENNQNAAYQIDGKAKITISSIYCEGNRIRDILLPSTFNGTITVNGGRFIHNNDGVTTTAIVEDLSTQHRNVDINNVEYVVGTTSTNLISNGLYKRVSQTGRVYLTNISVTGDIATLSSGNREIVYLGQAGNYAPDVFSFDQLPAVTFKRSFITHVAEMNVDSLPTSLDISDGTTTYNMLRGNSVAFQAGDLYRYNLGTTTWIKNNP